MYFDINKLIDNKTSEEITKASHKNLSCFATVTGIDKSGTVILRFDGEAEPSKKLYQRLSVYIPQIGDRVLLMRHNGTVLVIDKIVGIPKPFPLPEPDPPTTFEIKTTVDDSFYDITPSGENVLTKEFSEAMTISQMSVSGAGNKFTGTFSRINPQPEAVITKTFTEQITVESQIN